MEVTQKIKKEIYRLSDIMDLQKVILFGSYASGNASSDSDIDLCFITKDRRRKLDIIRDIRRNLMPLNYPLDVIVYHSGEFNERAKLTNTFEYKIQNEGVVLYE